MLTMVIWHVSEQVLHQQHWVNKDDISSVKPEPEQNQTELQIMTLVIKIRILLNNPNKNIWKIPLLLMLTTLFNVRENHQT